MNDWEELKELMQGLPRGSDQYNQVVGDAIVAVDRNIAQLEAELLDTKVREEAYYYKCLKLEAENQRLREALEMCHVNLYMPDEMLTFVQDALKDGE